MHQTCVLSCWMGFFNDALCSNHALTQQSLDERRIRGAAHLVFELNGHFLCSQHASTPQI